MPLAPEHFGPYSASDNAANARSSQDSLGFGGLS
jgi:hypothetical protein